MAANDVQIQIIGKDMASSAFKQVQNSAQETARSIETFGSSVGMVNNVLSNAAGYTLAIAGINGVGAAFNSTLGAAQDFYKTMETGSISMAGTLMSMGLLNNEAISWGSALSMSKNLMGQLNDQAILTGSSTREISDVFRAMLPAALNAKMTIGQTLELASTLTTTGKAMGLQETVLMRDVADLITGKNAQRTKLGSLLGISDADIAAAKESAGGLYAFLTERLRGEKEANENYLTTLEGRINHLKEAVARVGGVGFSQLFSGATGELAEIADKFVTVDNETKKITVNPELVSGLMKASETALIFGGQMKQIGSDIAVVAVPAAKLLGAGLGYAAQNAELVAAGIAAWAIAGKVNAVYMDIAAVTNGATTAQTFLGKAVMDTQTRYAQQVVIAEQAAAAQRAEAVATAEQQVQAALATEAAQKKVILASAEQRIQAELTGATMETAAVAAAMGQTRLAEAIRSTIIAEESRAIVSEQTSAKATRTAEIMNTANMAVKAGQIELAEAVIATNLTIEEQSLAAGVMAERMVLACELAKAGQIELAQSVLAASISLADEGTAATVAGTKAIAAAGESAAAQKGFTAAIVGTTAAQAEAGIAAEASAAKAVTGLSVAGTAAGNFGKILLSLAGGWIGVGVATAFAAKMAVDYLENANKIKSYNKKSEVFYDKDQNGEGHYYKKEWQDQATTDELGNYHGGYVKVELSPEEYQKQYEFDAKQQAIENGDYDALMGDGSAEKEKVQAMLDAITNKYDPEGEGKKKKKKHEKVEIADEAGEYSDMIKQAADAYGVDRNLFAALVKAESGFNPDAESGAGAIGFTQLMPDTANALGVNPYDPRENLMGGAHYLRQQLDAFGGNTRMALAAYNAGPRAVQKYGGVPPYEETQNYVNTIVGYLENAGHGSEDKAGDYYKKQQEAQKKYADMMKQLDSKINSTKQLPTRETETAKLDSEVVSMQKQASEIAAAGMDTSQINEKINQYKKLSTDKIIKNWQEAWRSIKDETEKFHAQLTENASAQADTEYAVTVQKLNKEKEEKKRAIMVDENDQQGVLAVDQWYNEQVLIAQKTRNQKQRDDMVAFYALEVQENDALLSLGKKTVAETNALNLEAYNTEISRLQDILDHQKLTYNERVQLEEKLSEIVQKRNSIKSQKYDGGATVAIEELKKQTTDYKNIYTSTWSSIDSTVKGHMENILTMNESLGTGIKETITGISEAVVKMFADILYQTYIMQPMKDWFTGILGNVSGGNKTETSSYSSSYSLLSSIIGGSSGGTSSSSSTFDIVSGGGFFNLPGLASGGLGSGWTIVGEEGPELVNFSNPGRVYNAKDTSAALNGNTNNSRNGPSVVMNIKTNDASSFKQSRGQILGSMGAAVRMAERNM